MSYLIDTNVISELTRKKPSARVRAWFERTPDEALHISVLTLGEIRSGVERLPAGGRREKLRVWLESTLPEWFQDRVLGVDRAVADRWGRLVGEIGRPVPRLTDYLRPRPSPRAPSRHAQHGRLRVSRARDRQPVGRVIRS